MKLALTLVAGDEAELLDAQLAFHVHAGVDLVVAAASGDAARAVLEAYEREGLARVVPVEAGESEDALVNRLASLAAGEGGADWVIDARAGEFWWPRGESLKDALMAIPERYAIVQALVRPLVVAAGEGSTVGRLVARRAVTADGRSGAAAERLLRRVYRADTDLAIRPVQPDLSGRVPLRAWYPIEVLAVPAPVGDTFDAEALANGLSTGELVSDTRLRDALRALSRDSGGVRAFSLPSEAPAAVAFRTPDIVDDAAYAADCAAVGEVDPAVIDRHIRELEDRIRWLEDRFWPRVVRTLSRIVHLGRSPRR